MTHMLLNTLETVNYDLLWSTVMRHTKNGCIKIKNLLLCLITMCAILAILIAMSMIENGEFVRGCVICFFAFAWISGFAYANGGFTPHTR